MYLTVEDFFVINETRPIKGLPISMKLIMFRGYKSSNLQSNRSV